MADDTINFTSQEWRGRVVLMLVGKVVGGGTAASVAVPRRSARIAGTAGGNQAVSTNEEDGASPRSPPRPANSRSLSCQGSPQSQSAASPLPCSSPKPLLPIRLSPVSHVSLSLPCL